MGLTTKGYSRDLYGDEHVLDLDCVNVTMLDVGYFTVVLEDVTFGGNCSFSRVHIISLYYFLQP